MMDPSETWRLHKVQTTLWFLSAPAEEKRRYLPPAFPAVLFHWDEGDFPTASPLHFMTQYCIEGCRQGSDLDRWSDLDPSGHVERQFAELRALLEALSTTALQTRDIAAFFRSPDAARFDEARERAARIVAELGWIEETAVPKHRCEDLLDEYSYGAYSSPGETLD